MGERKNIYVLKSTNINEAARKCALVIRDYSSDNPCPSKQLAEETQFTDGQIRRIIKYMRRCSEEDLEKYIKYYPISSKKGYYFPESWEQFAPCFVTLTKWHESLRRTIEPMRRKMDEEGIDWTNWIPETDTEQFINYLEELENEIPEINKHTSWFYEMED